MGLKASAGDRPKRKEIAMKRTILAVALPLTLLLIGCTSTPVIMDTPDEARFNGGAKDITLEPSPPPSSDCPATPDPTIITPGGIKLLDGELTFSDIGAGGSNSGTIRIENKGSEPIVVEAVKMSAITPKEGYNFYEEGLSWISFEPVFEIASHSTSNFIINLAIPKEANPPKHWECWVGLAETVESGGRVGYTVRVLVDMK